MLEPTVQCHKKRKSEHTEGLNNMALTLSTEKLPETCTLLLSLDLTVHETFDPRTHAPLATDVTENTALQILTGPHTTSTIETEKQLGKGGMGIVICGQQTLPDREVAIKKVLKSSNTYQRMLLQEAQITGQLEHPNIVPIHQISQNENGEIQIIMKKVQGKTLLEQLSSIHATDDNGDNIQLPVSQLQQLLLVCHALEYAHSRHIVHRDIKLENIMVGDFNEVFLMDWGLGMHTINQIGANPGIVGTPCYLAPEMLSGNPDDVDVRTDVYLMGATIHHLLMGTPRHDKQKVRDTLEQAHASAAYEYPLHIPSVFGDMINKACARSKSKRFQSMTELRGALEDALEHWEAIQLTTKATKRLRSFLPTLEDSTDTTHIGREFLRIRTQLESAVDMWNENIEAKEALIELLEAMIEYHVLRLEVSVADALYQELESPSETITQSMHKARTAFNKLAQAHERAQEYDPTQSKSGRRTLIVSLAATSVLLVSFAGAYSLFVSPEVTTIRLMYTGSLVSTSCILGVFLGRKTLLTNKLGAQMARTFTMTSLLATFNHWVGHIYGESPTSIMTVDIFIMAAAFALMKDSIPSAYRIAGMGVILGVIGLLYPQLVHPLLLTTILFSTMWALLDWYKEE